METIPKMEKIDFTIICIRDGYQREWDLCRAEKIVSPRQTGWISSIKDDSYNILASLTATFRYTCSNGNYSKTEFHDFLPLSSSLEKILPIESIEIR